MTDASLAEFHSLRCGFAAMMSGKAPPFRQAKKILEAMPPRAVMLEAQPPEFFEVPRKGRALPLITAAKPHQAHIVIHSTKPPTRHHDCSRSSGCTHMRDAVARRSSDRSSSGAARARRKFLRFFPDGFRDETYFAWERGYKWRAHSRWDELLDRSTFNSLIRKREFVEIASRAIRSLSGTNLLFSFESMALRDAVRETRGARDFAKGLFNFLHGDDDIKIRYEQWCAAVAGLPKKQSRVFTHPVTTVFGFIAKPERHIFLKPTVTRRSAEKYGFSFHYESRPSWRTYSSLLQFAAVLRRDLRDLKPRDMIDIQSFIWVQGSDEYN